METAQQTKQWYKNSNPSKSRKTGADSLSLSMRCGFQSPLFSAKSVASALSALSALQCSAVLQTPCCLHMLPRGASVWKLTYPQETAGPLSSAVSSVFVQLLRSLCRCWSLHTHAPSTMASRSSRRSRLASLAFLGFSAPLARGTWVHW